MSTLFDKYAVELEPSVSPVYGRDNEIRSIYTTLSRPQMANAILLGPAGVGKTAIVEEIVRLSIERRDSGIDSSLPLFKVYEVNLEAMNENGADLFVSRLREFMEEVQEKQRAFHDQGVNVEIVLFIDEFHKVAQIANGAAIESLKPVLARSGSKGLHLLAATTSEEYMLYIKPNGALTRRLAEIKINEPFDDVVLQILRSFVQHQAPSLNEVSLPDEVLQRIISYTHQYRPALAQPAVSVDVIDGLLGEYRYTRIAPSIDSLNNYAMAHWDVNPTWKLDIDEIYEYLENRVLFQELALNSIRNYLEIAVARFNEPGQPVGSFFFVGSTGTGKTELAKALTYGMYGRESAMLRFDMSEYQLDGDVTLFSQRISDAISEHPYSLVLLDEFEKSAKSVHNLLLQILDDGRLSDRYGRSVSFRNCFIVLTGNAGADTIKQAQAGEITAKEMLPALREKLGMIFSPEFLGRIDAIVPFETFTLSNYQELGMKSAERFVDSVYEQTGIFVSIDRRVIEYIVYNLLDVSSNAGGARALRSLVNDNVRSVVARTANRNPTDNFLIIKFEGEMGSDNKYTKGSTGRIMVGEHGQKSIGFIRSSVNLRLSERAAAQHKRSMALALKRRRELELLGEA